MIVVKLFQERVSYETELRLLVSRCRQKVLQAVKRRFLEIANLWPPVSSLRGDTHVDAYSETQLRVSGFQQHRLAFATDQDYFVEHAVSL